MISNVPGPRDPLFCAGAKLEANYPVSVVVDGVGLNITVMSYLDHLDFGIVADRDQVDDVWTLMDRLAARARRAHRGGARKGRQAPRQAGGAGAAEGVAAEGGELADELEPRAARLVARGDVCSTSSIAVVAGER